MKTLDLYLDEQLKDEAFRKEWEENQPEMDIIRAMADARISQNLTQKELAERTGIHQAGTGHLSLTRFRTFPVWVISRHMANADLIVGRDIRNSEARTTDARA